jgi:hypothetical protein
VTMAGVITVARDSGWDWTCRPQRVVRVRRIILLQRRGMTDAERFSVDVVASDAEIEACGAEELGEAERARELRSVATKLRYDVEVARSWGPAESVVIGNVRVGMESVLALANGPLPAAMFANVEPPSVPAFPGMEVWLSGWNRATVDIELSIGVVADVLQ